MPLLSTIISPVSSKNSLFFTSNFVACNKRANLYTISGYTSGAVNQFVQLYDTTTYRVAHLKPVSTTLIGPNNNFSVDFPNGLAFQNGIVAVNSTAALTHVSGGFNIYFTAAFSN